MATGSKSVKIDLHPMHQQLLANLAVLEASKDPRAKKAIKVLKDVDKALQSIECGQMSIDVTFGY